MRGLKLIRYPYRLMRMEVRGDGMQRKDPLGH